MHVCFVLLESLGKFIMKLPNWGVFGASEMFISDYFRNLMYTKENPKTNSELTKKKIGNTTSE
jgi:hypothetical protein